MHLACIIRHNFVCTFVIIIFLLNIDRDVKLQNMIELKIKKATEHSFFIRRVSLMIES
jgi:hypothetical protein